MRDHRRKSVRRVCRWVIALLLLPFCLGATIAVARVVRASDAAFSFWAVCGSGAACWLIVFLSLPRPTWLYVVGHEMTHVLWSWLFGGRVRSFRATSHGGHVTVTKVNFLVVLAPYFFPFYAMLWSVLCLLARALVGGSWWEPLFHFGLGIAYAFHVTLTLSILRLRQPDLDVEGWFFSTVIIWLGNALVALAALPGLTRSVSVFTAFGWMMQSLGELLTAFGRFR